jgi:hypothetical protein
VVEGIYRDSDGTSLAALFVNVFIHIIMHHFSFDFSRQPLWPRSLSAVPLEQEAWSSRNQIYQANDPSFELSALPDPTQPGMNG